MKTRRNYGSKQRMTVSSNVVSTRDTSGKKDQTTFDSPDDTLSKEPTVSHETRSQKNGKVNGQQEDHAETKAPSPNQSQLSPTNIRVATRSSARPQKRRRTSITSPQVPVHQDGNQNTGTSTAKKKNGKKTKRQWESWGMEDKNAFFDALHEHGKDFDKIQVILQTRHKRRGDPKNVIKNKEQVRHFYYRTLNKITKYIPKDKHPTTESDPHRRTVLELRSLTCFGELRKKIGGLGEKQGKKLHELLDYGWTTIRQSGRNVRLKAPTCRALKKLTSADTSGKCEESSNHPPPIPSKLNLEFKPVDNATWLAVQGLSKNPRMKTTVSCKKPLSLIIAFLTKKWPVKSCKPKTNEFLTLCVAVPVGFFVNEGESTQKESISNSDSLNQDTNTSASNLQGDAVKLTDVPDKLELLAGGKVQSTDQPTRVNNNTQSNESKNTSVAGSTENSPNHPKLWSSKNCGNITIGDIYCKLQRPPKLKFEYLFEEDETPPTRHNHNALLKLVEVAKTEFYTTKKRATTNKATCNNADTRMPAPTTRTRLPFILPSIVHPATRHIFSQAGLVNPTSSTNATITTNYINARKRQRKNQLPVTQLPTTVVQRKLLPRPVNAMPRGAVAVSFIPQPVQTLSPIPSSPCPSPGNDNVLGAASPSMSPKQAQTNTTTSTISLSSGNILPSLPSPSQASPIMTVSSPVSSSNVITTVLEMGIQQQPNSTPPQDILDTLVTSQENITNKTLSSSLSNMSCIDNSTVTLPVDHLIHTLHNFPTTSIPNRLDNEITTVSGRVTLDPAMNEDSGSELLASIMGLNEFTTTQTSTLSSVSHTQTIGEKSDVHELTSGIGGGGCGVSFSTNSLIDMLTSTATETVSSAATGTSTTAGLFFNSGSDGSSDAFSNEKVYLSPTSGAATLFTSPQTSPLRMTSPIPDSHWFNGESSDISLSFLEKLTVSPEKDSKLSFEAPSVPLYAAIRDSVSQDSLFGSKPITETTQAERLLRAIMDENSVDFVKKFQDLTKQVSRDERELIFGGENSSDGCSSSGMGALSFKNLIDKSDSNMSNK